MEGARRLSRLLRLTESLGSVFAGLAAAVVLVQAGWITFGVVMRYVFRSPDRMVTEATALLLFPVAFAGLAYALQSDAYPRVSIFADMLPRGARSLLSAVNRAVVLAVAAFFAVAATDAAARDFHSGAASEILLWPRFYFWVPSALSLWLFTFYAALRLAAATGAGADDEGG